MKFVPKGVKLMVFAGLLCVFAGVVGAVTPPPPGVVVDYYNPENGIYVGGPSIAILPNGDYVVAHDQYPGAIAATILRSQNKGIDWTWVTQLPGQYESTLFVHNGALYLIGGFNNGAGSEYVAIRKSTDGGSTWTEATSATSGLITPPSTGYNGAPTPVLIHNGRIWRAFEKVDPAVPTGFSREFRAMVVSAPVDANLLNASSWTVSNTLLMGDYISNGAWMEGNAVAAPDGSVKNILRTGWLGADKAAVVQVSSNGSTLTFSPQTIIDFPGGCVKFVIRYDPQSDLYWSLVNKQTNPTAQRNRLVLVSSPDLVNWTAEAAILEHADSAVVGFQYADWQIDGQDIIFVSRTAFGGSVPYSSSPFHDAEYITFHRIPNFRMLSEATISTIDASDDAEIDWHINWRADTKGIPHPEWSHDASELRVRIYDPNQYTGAQGSHVLIKWDFAGIPATDVIVAVTLEMAGWDNPDGMIDVYAIAEGDWDESTVTWNSWEATPKSLVLLGQLSSSGPANTSGNTIFSNPNLTELVQEWISGNQANYGLILKMSGTAPVGDSFSSHEDTWESAHAPQLVIYHLPSSEFASVEGTVNPSGYTGDLQNVGVQIELLQNGVTARTERTLLDASGSFSMDLVPKGTYDVAVKAFTYIPELLTNISVSADPTDLGTIVLGAGDLNGDSIVNLLDFAIMANNWLSVEE